MNTRPSQARRGFPDRHTPPHIVTLVIITGISALSMNMFLPSLPGMAVWFGTEYSIMQLAVSGYLAATAVLQLFIGQLSDRFGRRPVMLAGIAIMLLATIVCIFSTDIVMFMTARVAQASIVSGVVLSRAIVRDTVSEEEAASMIGYITMGMSVAPMIGPSIGGVLDGLWGWQASFALLFLLGLGALAITWFDLGETAKPQTRIAGSSFAAAGILLRSPQFLGYVLTTTFASGLFFSWLGAAPFVGNVIFGMSPSELGLQFLFMSAGYMAGNFLAGRFTRRLGIMRMMINGNVVGAIGIIIAMLLPVAGVDNAMAFFIPLTLIGVGNGICLPGANAGIVSVRPDMAGLASGLGGAITLGGGAALSTLATAVMSEQSGPLPLLVVMLVSAALAISSTLYIIYAGDRR